MSKRYLKNIFAREETSKRNVLCFDFRLYVIWESIASDAYYIYAVINDNQTRARDFVHPQNSTIICVRFLGRLQKKMSRIFEKIMFVIADGYNTKNSSHSTLPRCKNLDLH